MTLPDKDSFDALGGELESAGPIADPLTQLEVEADNKARCNIAMATRTLIRAWLCFKPEETTEDIELVSHDAVWGSSNAVKPTIEREADGIFDLEWPSTVEDERGESHAVNLRWCFTNPQADETSGLFHSNASVIAPNKVRVWFWQIVTGDGTATGLSDQPISIDVFVG